jgi:hypothetical protein
MQDQKKKSGRPPLAAGEKKILFHGMACEKYIQALGGSVEVAKIVSEYIKELGVKVIRKEGKIK